MNYLKNMGLMTVTLLFLFGCTPKQMVKQESIPGVQNTQNSQMVNTAADTLLYTIDFADGLERDKFVKKFKEFINNYPFTNVQSTGYNSVIIRIQPSSGSLSDSVHPGTFTDGTSFTNDPFMMSNGNQGTDITISGKDTVYTQFTPDTDVPVNGGTLRLYTQRSFFDDYLIALVSTFPFDRNGSSGILAVTEQTARKLTIKINGRITNGKGKVLSALDIIDSWTSFVKMQPAEGFALFRQVEGMREFIDGREAVIRGLIATDQYTIQLRLLQPDPDIVDRLSTSRLLGAALKTGMYFEDSQGDDKVYISNKSSGKGSGYLDKLIVRQGGDVNPVLSFSLKKYDAIELNMINDLSYARTNLSKNSKLEIFGHDRYFISFNVKEQKARHYLSSLVNTQEILKNFVKAEGECIAAIENAGAGAMQIPPGAMHPGLIQPVKVLFRKDDPISKIIAEKLIADFAKGNIPCNLSACSMQEYEKALVTRNFGCAVGWVPDEILSERSEKIRLATMWFTDILDEKVRMDSFMELPLFSINRYLLLRTNIGMPSNKIQNLFVNPAK